MSGMVYLALGLAVGFALGQFVRILQEFLERR
jgi:hypothetical protein